MGRALRILIMRANELVLLPSFCMTIVFHVDGLRFKVLVFMENRG